MIAALLQDSHKIVSIWSSLVFFHSFFRLLFLADSGSTDNDSTAYLKKMKEDERIDLSGTCLETVYPLTLELCILCMNVYSPLKDFLAFWAEGSARR